MTRLRSPGAWPCLVVLALAWVGGPARAQMTDLTTQRPAVTTSGHAPTTSKPAGVGACAALWDLTHGVYVDYEPAGRFSELVSLLAANGISVSTTAVGLDNIDLHAYNVIVVCVGSAWNSAYTASEVAAIQNFQAGGGGLLVMGDNGNTNNLNINPVSVPLGTTCGLSVLLPLDLYVSNFIPHPIFGSISQIYMRAAGDLGVVLPSVAAAFEPAGAPVISLVEAPRTVITGDINLWGNEFIAIPDNTLLALNVFNWLCQPGATPARAESWGRLKTLYR